MLCLCSITFVWFDLSLPLGGIGIYASSMIIYTPYVVTAKFSNYDTPTTLHCYSSHMLISSPLHMHHDMNSADRPPSGLSFDILQLSVGFPISNSNSPPAGPRLMIVYRGSISRGRRTEEIRD
jgi:hypothetical protein